MAPAAPCPQPGRRKVDRAVRRATVRRTRRANVQQGLEEAEIDLPFDAEGLEFQDICQQCESCRCGPQGLFHSWRRCRVTRHDGHTMPSMALKVKRNLSTRTSAR